MDQQDFDLMKSFVAILGGLALAAIIFFFVAMNVTERQRGDSASSPAQQNSIAARIRPVGQVAIQGIGAEQPAALAKTDQPAGGEGPGANSGEKVVGGNCRTCHGTGVLGAPKIGSREDWAPRLEHEGYAELVHEAIRGEGNMPPRGGNPALTDEEIQMAVAYMLRESDLEVDEESLARHADGTPDLTPESAATSGGDQTEGDIAAGKAIYTKACFACHGTGAAGAPKLGDAAAWQDRKSQGMDVLAQHAVEGFQGKTGFMPPKGGHPYLSDQEIASAIAYMLSKSQ